MSTALIFAFAAAVASGEDVLPGITWRAASGCPDAAQLRQRLADLRTDAEPLEVEADAAVGIDPGGDYRMKVRLRRADAVSTRTLHARDCATLADAYALLVVVAAGRQRAPASRGSSFSDTLPRLTGEVAVAGHVEWGASPRLTGGPAIAGSVLGRRWRAGVELAYAAPRELPLSIALQRYEATALGGPTLRLPWGDVSFTLGLTAGAFVATSRAGAGLGDRQALWLAGQSAGRLAVRLSAHVFLTVAAAASVALTRVHFRHPVLGARLASTGAANLRGLLGVAFRIPGGRGDGNAR